MIGNELDLLCNRYICTTNHFIKNKLLNRIFARYERWVQKLSKKYSNCDYEEDDVRQHVYIGIANGIGGRRINEPLNMAIFRNVRKEISNHILHPLNTKKTSRSKDISMYDYWNCVNGIQADMDENNVISEDMGMSKPIWDEDRTILQMDLEGAIAKLSSLQRNIMLLWLEGYTIKDIKLQLNISSATHNTTVYNYFNEGLTKLSVMKDLRGYRCDCV